MPVDIDDFVTHRASLEAMLEDRYWDTVPTMSEPMDWPKITPARASRPHRRVYDLVHTLVGTVHRRRRRSRGSRELAREAAALLDGASRADPGGARLRNHQDLAGRGRGHHVPDRWATGPSPAQPTQRAVLCRAAVGRRRRRAYATCGSARRSKAAPGRVHGGMVAAVFDDILGMAMARVRSPGFTGRLDRALPGAGADEPAHRVPGLGRGARRPQAAWCSRKPGSVVASSPSAMRC